MIQLLVHNFVEFSTVKGFLWFKLVGELKTMQMYVHFQDLLLSWHCSYYTWHSGGRSGSMVPTFHQRLTELIFYISFLHPKCLHSESLICVVLIKTVLSMC